MTTQHEPRLGQGFLVGIGLFAIAALLTYIDFITGGLIFGR